MYIIEPIWHTLFAINYFQQRTIDAHTLRKWNNETSNIDFHLVTLATQYFELCQINMRYAFTTKLDSLVIILFTAIYVTNKFCLFFFFSKNVFSKNVFFWKKIMRVKMNIKNYWLLHHNNTLCESPIFRNKFLVKETLYWHFNFLICPLCFLWLFLFLK